MPKTTEEIIAAATDGLDDGPGDEDILDGDELPDGDEGDDDPEVVGDEGDEGEEDDTPISQRRNDDDDEEDDPDGDEDEDVDPAVDAAARRARGEDPLDKLLDEYGFRLPKAGQRENRLPPARVRARVKTALQKYAKTFEGQISTLTGKTTGYESRIAEIDRVDALLASTSQDPDAARRYVEMLAVIHPAFKAFLTPGSGGQPGAGKVEVSQALKDLGEMPKPDIVYDDKSTAYSPEQWQKRDDWLMAKASIQAEERVLKAMEARYGPIERDHKAAASAREQAPKIAAQINYFRTTYGKYFTDQEAMETATKGSSDISKYRAANPGVTFEQAVQAVLVPKIIGNRTTIRQELLTEQKRKRKAATRTSGQPVRQAGRPQRATGRRTTAQVIMDSVDGIDDDDDDQ